MKIAVFVMAIMVMCICPGSISEGDHPVPEPRHQQHCRFPKGNHGSVHIDGCIKSTCTNGKWKPKMRTDICCYKQKVYKPNTVLDKIVSADNCSSTTIGCGAVGELEFKHKSCSDPASKQQVDQLEKSMEQQFEEVVAKIENVNETSGKHSVEIYETVKEVNKEIQKMNISIENKVDDLKNETTWQNVELSDKVNDVVQKIENLTKTVNQNMADQNEMSLQMMKTLFNLTKLMEKHSEDTHIVEGEQYTTTSTATTTPLPILEGVLIEGGWGTASSAELFMPHTGTTCFLQGSGRWGHSLDGIGNEAILCGGGQYGSLVSCLQFLQTSSTGSWGHYATLAQSRYKHTTHVFKGEKDVLMLVGGHTSPATTEILGSGRQYDLEQDTYEACSIPDQSTYILTGGKNSLGYLKSVVRYDIKGFVENLPELPNAIGNHGCGFYMDKTNTKVLIVAGGSGNAGTLSSTLLLPSGATSWISGESLPRAMAKLVSVPMDNHLLFIGGVDGSDYRREILRFDGNWTEVGKMKNARSSQEATKIEIGDQLDISACL